MFSLPCLKPGDRVIGKWNGSDYLIKRKLGEGANGSVYLARSPFDSSPCALKIGFDPYELQSEMNALRSLLQLQREDRKLSFPRLYEADDWEVDGESVPFYAMTFVPGIPIGSVAKTSGALALLACGRKLLLALRELHQCGYAFGDLKSGNVLVSPQGEPRLIDFGGTTKFGYAVKQYTELYDRGYWGSGERTAEASYDLFSFAVLMLEVACGTSRVKALAGRRERRNKEALLALLDGCSELKAVALSMRRMIRGGYIAIDEAISDWDNGLKQPAACHRSGALDWSVYWFAVSAFSFAACMWWVVLK